MSVQKKKVGSFLVQIDKEDVVTVPRIVANRLIDALEKVQTSALVVRLDMSPWEGEGVPPVYEVEFAPGGIMFQRQEIVDEISCLADVAFLSPRYARWREAYDLLSELTGWKVVESWEKVKPGSRVYLSGSASDVDLEMVDDRSLTLATDPFASKAEILKITGGTVIRAGETISFSEFKQFEHGIVLKPVHGYGCRDIAMHPKGSSYGWMRGRGGVSSKRIRKALGTPNQEDMLVQPFFPPEVVKIGLVRKELRIWRIYAVRPDQGHRFCLIGGAWNRRPHLLVHGASNTVSGPVVVEGRPKGNSLSSERMEQEHSAQVASRAWPTCNSW